LQGIVVERYYSSNAADAANAVAEGAVVPLTVGSVTYRVYVDMNAGYKFNNLFGSAANNLTVNSTTNFFNDPNQGVTVNPGTISVTNVRKNTAMLDSYFTTGGTATGKVGVRKTEDTDGTIGNEQGILANNPGGLFGFPINGGSGRDGMLPSSPSTYVVPNVLGPLSPLNALDQTAGNSIVINNGAVAALGGIVGAAPSNMVLVAQFTTSGTLSFALNVQIQNISTGVAETYVANPISNELTHPTLVFPIVIPTVVNDTPAAAVNIGISGNSFPNCGAIAGDLSQATDSPQSPQYTGVDGWYRFTATSTAVSITMTSAGMDNIIGLYSNGLVAMPGNSLENSAGPSGNETLNYSGLTVGQQYFISAGNFVAGPGSPFTLCIRQLLSSTCAGTSFTYDLCSNIKPSWTGASNYTFRFTPTGLTGGSITNITVGGQLSLSTASLGLRYGGTYSVRVDANYNNLTFANNLPDSPITVLGFNLCNITIAPHAVLATKASQLCPASLLRGNILNAKPFICGATGFTVQFQQKSACSAGTDIGLPFTVNTAGASSNLPLGFTLPQQLAAQSWYQVRWRPEFAYGSGTFGTSNVIFIGGAAMDENLDMDALVNGTVRADGSFVQASLYPNPNNGEMVNLNVAGVESDNVFIRIMDGMGRVVYTNRYTVDGSLSTVVTFAKPMAAGLYMVEFTVDGEIMTQRMLIQK